MLKKRKDRMPEEKRKLCDGVNDCIDRADEDNCTAWGSDYFHCNKTVVYLEHVMVSLTARTTRMRL